MPSSSHHLGGKNSNVFAVALVSRALSCHTTGKTAFGGYWRVTDENTPVISLLL